ncbi:hypothetical protein GCM10027589_21840 [Actinocorallia lasiicapitis]
MITALLVTAAILLWGGWGGPEARLRHLQGDEPVPSTRLHSATTRIRDAANNRLRRGHRRRENHASVIELCDNLAAELTAGRTPEDALSAAIQSLSPPLSTLLHPIPSAPDIPAALEASATLPGTDPLRLLAACWRVGVERGATLATVVDTLAAALRDDAAHREHVTSQLAAPRATARLLAVLPLLGIGMAAALGTHPLAFLFTTLPGLTALILGLTLNLTGLYWTHQIAHSAEAPT